MERAGNCKFKGGGSQKTNQMSGIWTTVLNSNIVNDIDERKILLGAKIPNKTTARGILSVVD